MFVRGAFQNCVQAECLCNSSSSHWDLCMGRTNDLWPHAGTLENTQSPITISYWHLVYDVISQIHMFLLLHDSYTTVAAYSLTE